jgi:thioredoxin 1
MIVLGTFNEKQIGVAGRRLLTSIVVPGGARVAPNRIPTVGQQDGTFLQISNDVNKLRAALGKTHACSNCEESQKVLADLAANIEYIHDTTRAGMAQLIDSKEQALAEASEATAKLNLVKVAFACMMFMVLVVIFLKRLRPFMRTSDPMHRNEEGADIEIEGEARGSAPAMRFSGIEQLLSNVGGTREVAHVVETKARLKPLMSRFVPTRTRAPMMAADNGELLTEGHVADQELASSRGRTGPAVTMQESGPSAIVRQVNLAQFNAEIEDVSTPVLVDIFATWCPPCQKMAPHLDEVARQLEGKVRVLKVDAEEEPMLKFSLGVDCYPTLFFIKDVKIQFKASGGKTLEEILALVDEHLLQKQEVPEVA